MSLQYVTFRWRLGGLEERGNVGSRLVSPVQHLIFHHCTHIHLPLILIVQRALVSKLTLLAIVMVFLAQETIPVPTQDILSWIFDDVPYDQHKPVCDAPIPVSNRQLNLYIDIC